MESLDSKIKGLESEYNAAVSADDYYTNLEELNEKSLSAAVKNAGDDTAKKAKAIPAKTIKLSSPK